MRNFCTVFKAAPRAARAAATARTPPLPLALPLRRRQRRSAGAKGNTGPLEPRGSRLGRGGFDKGTLAAALIGQTRAVQKPARFANKRTDRRPLSNSPLRLSRANPTVTTVDAKSVDSLGRWAAHGKLWLAGSDVVLDVDVVGVRGLLPALIPVLDDHGLRLGVERVERRAWRANHVVASRRNLDG